MIYFTVILNYCLFKKSHRLMEICCFISFSGHKNKVKSVLNLNKRQLRLQIPKQHQAALWWLMKELHNIGLDGWTYLRRVHAWVAMSCSCRRLCLSSSTLKWMQPLSASSVSSSIRFSFICSVYRMRKTETDAEVWYRRQKCDSLKWKQSVNMQTVSESV